MGAWWARNGTLPLGSPPTAAETALRSISIEIWLTAPACATTVLIESVILCNSGVGSCGSGSDGGSANAGLGMRRSSVLASPWYSIRSPETPSTTLW